MAVSKHPSITPETSSGEGLDEEPTSRGEAKWKRFHPFRVVRKIFRRRVKQQGTGEVPDASKKSWSTSELQCVQDTQGKYEVPSPPYKIGLSVSHDSIFSPESSNLVNTEEISRPQGSSLSVQHAGIKNMFKDELFTRVRARRDSDDDDIGLPHSPCTSPTTVDVLAQGLKAKSSKLQTTCSAGSLISMGSSENDEDSAGQSSSGHSSRMSLLDRRSLDSEGDADLSQPVPLNHNAAHHKISVRPKRTYGLPQRRLKQLAASRLSTLPSTPEVTEDSVKAFLKIESTETTTVSSASLVHAISEVVATTSKHATERHCTIESSADFVQTEHAQHERQEFHTEQISQSESSHVIQLSEKVTQEEINSSCNLLESNFEILNHSFLECAENTKIEASSRTTVREKLHSFQNIREEQSQNLNEIASGTAESSFEATAVKESFKVIKSNFQEIKAESVQREGIEIMQDGAPLRVSALIKSIERSDSLSKGEKGINLKLAPKPPNSKHDNEGINDLMVAVNNTFGLDSVKEVRSVEGNSQSNDFSQSHSSNLVPEAPSHKIINSSNDLKSSSYMHNLHFNELKNKPNTLSDLSELVKEKSPTALSEGKQFETEMKQLLQNDNMCTDHQNGHVMIPSLFPEEESIMSDKFVTSSSIEKILSNEEGQVSISHHSHSSYGSEQIKITEAHNLVTVDDQFNLQAFQSISTENTEKSTAVEPWVSSVDISSNLLNSDVSDVTVNSLTSTVCSQKMTEDKVTISVNSAVEEKESKSPNLKKKGKAPELPKSLESRNTKDLVKDSKPTSSVNHNSSNNTKTKKSHLPDETSPVSQVRTTNVYKRVSVEIVPFSQRIKERKYQPLSFSNKDTTPDPAKRNSSVGVERKLSDRKVTTKIKEPEKSNNRHSFSGALSTDSDRRSADVSPDKLVSKAEKLQYPVQIRIHNGKSKNESEVARDFSKTKSVESKTNKEIKRSSTSETSHDVKFQLQSAKVTRNEVKYLKDQVKQGNDAPTKWEVKIHPAAQIKKETTSSPQCQSETKQLVSESFSKLTHNVTNNKKSESFSKSTHDVANTKKSESFRKSSHDATKNKKSDSFNKSTPDMTNSKTSEAVDQSSLSLLITDPKDIQDRGPSPNSLSESPPAKSRENSWKSPRDTPPSQDPEPELFRVFARRSIKQKHGDKDKSDDKDDNNMSDTSSLDGSFSLDILEKFEETHQSSDVSSSTVIKISESAESLQDASPELMKRKSRSFNEREKLGPRSISPLKEIALNQRPSQKAASPEVPTSQSETAHRRQRLASVPDLPLLPPPGPEPSAASKIQQNDENHEDNLSLSSRSEHLHRAASLSISTTSTLSNGSSACMGLDSLKGKENPDILGSKEGPTPAWLQLAQQRREMREQRERLLLGSSTNAFIDGSSKPSRSSKVWDMVNNFQKMQMT